MKLQSITLENVRGVHDGAYSFLTRLGDTPLAVALVTGGQGAGKTSLLEAIAAAKESIGSYGGPADGRKLLRRGATQGRIESTWLLSEAEMASAGLDAASYTVTWEIGEAPSRPDVPPRLRRLFATYTRDPQLGKAEYFPAGRRLTSPTPRPPGPPVMLETEARLRLARDPDKYQDLVVVLHDLALRDAAHLAEVVSVRGVALRKNSGDALAPFRQAVAATLPDLRLAGVDITEPRSLHFLRRDNTPLTLHELSEGEQQGVLFALAFRHFGLNHSLVLIDEPELHVHAADRVRFLHALVGLGIDNQFIAATGSMELLAAASRGQVLELQNRAPERTS